MGRERVIGGRTGSLFFDMRGASPGDSGLAASQRCARPGRRRLFRPPKRRLPAEVDSVPFEIRDEGGFHTARLFGVLDMKELDAITSEVERMEEAGTIADRLTDLTGLERIDVGFEEVFGLALRRSQRPIRAPVRSALVASKPVQFGFARMFQMLNDNPRIQIRIFGTLQEAQQWLRSSRR
jgi:hypothetical protein